MTLQMPEGVRAAVRLFLVSDAGEEVTIEVPNLQYLPPIDRPDPATFLSLCSRKLRTPVKVVGNWRFMTDREVDAYLAREKAEDGDGFNPYGCGPVPVEPRDV